MNRNALILPVFAFPPRPKAKPQNNGNKVSCNARQAKARQGASKPSTFLEMLATSLSFRKTHRGYL